MSPSLKGGTRPKIFSTVRMWDWKVKEDLIRRVEDPNAVTAQAKGGLRESIRVSVRLVDAPRLIQKTHAPQKSA